jgi:hypothetical protein
MALFAMSSEPGDSTSAKAYSLDDDSTQRRLLRALLDIDANKLLPAVRRLSTTQTNEILWLLNQIDEGIRQAKQCFAMRHSGWKFSGLRRAHVGECQRAQLVAVKINEAQAPPMRNQAGRQRIVAERAAAEVRREAADIGKRVDFDAQQIEFGAVGRSSRTGCGQGAESSPGRARQ